jgi:7-cyano-7-deazaguanine synthase
MSRELAVVLVSGGMDSLVTAAIAARDYDLSFLHASYGQRTEERERKAFEDIADFYNVSKRLVVRLDYLREIGGSSLTDKRIEVPRADLERKGIPSSYVPFRNANLLAVACSFAEAIGASKVFIGAVEADSSGYPDCREEFFRAFNRAVELGTRKETIIEIVTPLVRMSKKEIVLKGVELSVPFELSWSCYKENDVACGICDSCVLRRRAFRQADLSDPILYRHPYPLDG